MYSHLFLKLMFVLIGLSVSGVGGAAVAGRLPGTPPHELTFYSRRDGNFEIYLADVERALVVNLTRHPDQDIRPAWSPDGQQMAFYSTRGQEQNRAGLYLLDGDGQRLLTASGLGEAYPSWSPDGRTIAYASDRTGGVGLYRVDATGGKRRRISYHHAALLSYSPDGRRILFMSSCDNNCDIFVIDADGGNAQAITRNGTFDVYPTWSPDSRQIAFMANQTNYFEIYVVDADCATAPGGCAAQARQMTSNRDFDGFPVWSPDGERLLFSSNRSGDFELYVLDTACGPAAADCERAAQRLTSQSEQNISPSWSPDGRWIGFISGRAVYVMDAAGGQPRHIMDDALPDQTLVWRP